MDNVMSRNLPSAAETPIVGFVAVRCSGLLRVIVSRQTHAARKADLEPAPMTAKEG